MIILGKDTSINVRKVLWTCAEIGVSYQLKPSSGTDVQHLNPHAMVPVVVDGGEVLWESNTICRYLASKHARHDLLPAQPMARAHVEKWMDWQATELNTAWRYAFMALVRGSAAHTDLTTIAASIRDWNRLMQLLDAQLSHTGRWVAGDNFTLADIVLGLAFNRWLSTPMERPALPALSAWAQLLGERPGWLLHGANGTP
ncbi:glutathione S-transferase N-terminal domain-containing protein [Duganella levis]|uniref:Glutathione S-transferase n=1 Tax=Duganella levis TaxID=2692169 RepID=A0ABW9W3A0_9BURK|nr:glutathione S-transferase N-terminal domain-containing protein [Duganella levis]MYN28360.1 glutathione S-transferase [Duganella levis]